MEELGPGKFEIVIPSISMLAQPTVAVVDGNVDRHGTRQLAEATLELAVEGRKTPVEIRVTRELYELGEITKGQGIFIRPTNARVYEQEEKKADAGK